MIYRISNFDDGPHWDAAFIEAESSHEARAILQAALDEDMRTHANDFCGSVMAPKPHSEWFVVRVHRPLLFVLGAGCRES